MMSSTGSLRLFCGGYEGVIHTLDFDPSARTLTSIQQTTDAGVAPTWLVFSRDGKFVYVIDEWAPERMSNNLHAFAVNGDGSLQLLNSTASQGKSCCHAVLSESDPPRLLAANYISKSIANIPTLPSGEFEVDLGSHQVVDFTGTGQPGPHPRRQHQDHPHAIEIDPTGKFAVVPDLGTDELELLTIDDNGKLAIVGLVDLAPSDGPRHVLFRKTSTGDTRLYVLNELGNSVSIFSIDYSTATPAVRALQTGVSVLPPTSHAHQSGSFASWHCAELKISSDHKLYVSNRAENHDPLNGTSEGPADVIAIFDLDPATGLVVERSASFVSSEGRAARHFSLSGESLNGAVAAKDEFVAVAQHDSDEVIIFDRQSWTVVARIDKVGRPACVLWA